MIYLNDTPDTLDLGAALQRMPAWRREITLRYATPALQRQSAAAFILLQEALQREYAITGPIEFVAGRHGKPALRNRPDIHFSLSHCRAAALCAVSRQPVGADIEAVRGLSADMVAYVMNAGERERIARADDPDLAFISLWTQKEAVAKLTGAGLQSGEQIRRLLTEPHPPVLTEVDPQRRFVWSVCSEDAGLLLAQP